MITQDLVAVALAGATDEEQAAFFNAFFRHLRIACQGRAEYQMGMIADHLDGATRVDIEALAGMVQATINAEKERNARHATSWAELLQVQEQVRAEEQRLQKLREEPV